MDPGVVVGLSLGLAVLILFILIFGFKYARKNNKDTQDYAKEKLLGTETANRQRSNTNICLKQGKRKNVSFNKTELTEDDHSDQNNSEKQYHEPRQRLFKEHSIGRNNTKIQRTSSACIDDAYKVDEVANGRESDGRNCYTDRSRKYFKRENQIDRKSNAADRLKSKRADMHWRNYKENVAPAEENILLARRASVKQTLEEVKRNSTLDYQNARCIKVNTRKGFHTTSKDSNDKHRPSEAGDRKMSQPIGTVNTDICAVVPVRQSIETNPVSHNLRQNLDRSKPVNVTRVLQPQEIVPIKARQPVLFKPMVRIAEDGSHYIQTQSCMETTMPPVQNNSFHEALSTWRRHSEKAEKIPRPQSSIVYLTNREKTNSSSCNPPKIKTNSSGVLKCETLPYISKPNAHSKAIECNKTSHIGPLSNQQSTNQQEFEPLTSTKDQLRISGVRKTETLASRNLSSFVDGTSDNIPQTKQVVNKPSALATIPEGSQLSDNVHKSQQSSTIKPQSHLPEQIDRHDQQSTTKNLRMRPPNQIEHEIQKSPTQTPRMRELQQIVHEYQQPPTQTPRMREPKQFVHEIQQAPIQTPRMREPQQIVHEIQQLPTQTPRMREPQQIVHEIQQPPTQTPRMREPKQIVNEIQQPPTQTSRVLSQKQIVHKIQQPPKQTSLVHTPKQIVHEIQQSTKGIVRDINRSQTENLRLISSKNTVSEIQRSATPNRQLQSIQQPFTTIPLPVANQYLSEIRHTPTDQSSTKSCQQSEEHREYPNDSTNNIRKSLKADHREEQSSLSTSLDQRKEQPLASICDDGMNQQLSMSEPSSPIITRYPVTDARMSTPESLNLKQVETESLPDVKSRPMESPLKISPAEMSHTDKRDAHQLSDSVVSERRDLKDKDILDMNLSESGFNPGKTSTPQHSETNFPGTFTETGAFKHNGAETVTNSDGKRDSGSVLHSVLKKRRRVISVSSQELSRYHSDDTLQIEGTQTSSSPLEDQLRTSAREGLRFQASSALPEKLATVKDIRKDPDVNALVVDIKAKRKSSLNNSC